MAMAAKRIRPNPSRFGGTFGLIPPPRNPLIQINSQQFDGVKKFDVGHALPGLDPDACRQNALSNLSQALQVEFQNQTRNIIRLNNHSSKSSTPHTETPTPKSVVHQNDHKEALVEEVGDTENGASDLSRRNSVLTEHVLESEKDLARPPVDDEIIPGGANSMMENKVNGFRIDDIQNNIDPSDDNSRMTNDDDLNLEEVMKQRATANISSIVHDAVVHQQQQLGQQQQQLHVQQHQIRSPIESTTPHNQQPPQQPANSQILPGQSITRENSIPEPRTQADVLKDNLANMKEEMDSDCELVEDEMVSAFVYFNILKIKS